MRVAPTAAELEVRRIARLVRHDPADLEGLAAADVDDLRALRDQIAAVLYDGHDEHWARAVAVANVVPAGLAATLSEKALGPVLSARVTPLTPPRKAVDIAAKLSPTYMADVAVEVDPRRITDLVAEMPPATVAAIGEVLSERGEWLVMADFVAAVPPTTLRTTVDALDEGAVLRIVVLLEDPDRATQVVALLDDDRIARLREAARTRGLEDHLAHLTATVDDRQRTRLEG